MSASELPDTLAKKLPRYPHLPVTLLGRLAVDQGMKGKGMGEYLLLDALRRCLEAAGNIAAMAVLVDAKDDAAEAFYLSVFQLSSAATAAAPSVSTHEGHRRIV